MQYVASDGNWIFCAINWKSTGLLINKCRQTIAEVLTWPSFDASLWPLQNPHAIYWTFYYLMVFITSANKMSGNERVFHRNKFHQNLMGTPWVMAIWMKGGMEISQQVNIHFRLKNFTESVKFIIRVKHPRNESYPGLEHLTFIPESPHNLATKDDMWPSRNIV